MNQNDNVVEVIEYNSGSKLVGAVTDNFDTILELAKNYADIKRMKAESEIKLAEMDAARERLLAESEVYVKQKEIETKSIVERMEVIRAMMNDFYQHTSGNMTSEDFSTIITEIVNQMGRVKDDR